jgi:3-hydroxybutyrate dehydrogenase
MTDDDLTLEPPELTADDLLEVDDPYFSTGSVAIVTGAASGIGQATSIALAANDLTVCGLDVDEDGLAETADKIETIAGGGEFVPTAADLTDDVEVEAAVEKATEEGRVRYLANIAGMQHIASLQNFPMAKYDLITDVMLRAPFLLSKHVLGEAQTLDGPTAIANMSSVHGQYATKDKPAYITAKHGLTGLTRATAAQGLEETRAFSVSVGYVLTPLMINQIEDTAEERGISKQQVVDEVMLGQARTKEFITPAEVANLFTFGLSKHGRLLNGADLLWDGGYTHTYN